jgi:hypothetical protein
MIVNEQAWPRCGLFNRKQAPSSNMCIGGKEVGQVVCGQVAEQVFQPEGRASREVRPSLRERRCRLSEGGGAVANPDA